MAEPRTYRRRTPLAPIQPHPHQLPLPLEIADPLRTQTSHCPQPLVPFLEALSHLLLQLARAQRAAAAQPEDRDERIG